MISLFFRFYDFSNEIFRIFFPILMDVNFILYIFLIKICIANYPLNDDFLQVIGKTKKFFLIDAIGDSEYGGADNR